METLSEKIIGTLMQSYMELKGKRYPYSPAKKKKTLVESFGTK